MAGRTIQDTIVVCMSDMHSGGTTALFPNRFWQGQHQNHTPTKFQRRLFKHFKACAVRVREARQGKRVIVVHNGDAIDGDHHGSLQIVTRLKKEQIEIHQELMDYFLQSIDFDKESGDKLYYTVGTESHVNDDENIIGEDMGAEKEGSLFVFDNLHININGREVWFIHHGTSAGKGANAGNAHRNWLKNVFYERTRDGLTPPDMIVTSHTHVASYSNFIGRIKNDFHTLRGIITPSWQMKTRYAYKVAATSKNEVGLWYFQVKASGDLIDPVPLLMDTTTKKPILL